MGRERTRRRRRKASRRRVGRGRGGGRRRVRGWILQETRSRRSRRSGRSILRRVRVRVLGDASLSSDGPPASPSISSARRDDCGSARRGGHAPRGVVRVQPSRVRPSGGVLGGVRRASRDARRARRDRSHPRGVRATEPGRGSCGGGGAASPRHRVAPRGSPPRMEIPRRESFPAGFTQSRLRHRDPRRGRQHARAVFRALRAE